MNNTKDLNNLIESLQKCFYAGITPEQTVIAMKLIKNSLECAYAMGQQDAWREAVTKIDQKIGKTDNPFDDNGIPEHDCHAGRDSGCEVCEEYASKL